MLRLRRQQLCWWCRGLTWKLMWGGAVRERRLFACPLGDCCCSHGCCCCRCCHWGCCMMHRACSSGGAAWHGKVVWRAAFELLAWAAWAGTQREQLPHASGIILRGGTSSRKPDQRCFTLAVLSKVAHSPDPAAVRGGQGDGPYAPAGSSCRATPAGQPNPLPASKIA